MSFPAPDQVEGDVKDTVYQIARIAHIVIPDPRSQVEGDVKDTVYQTTGIAFFIRMRFPIKLEMTLWTKGIISCLQAVYQIA